MIARAPLAHPFRCRFCDSNELGSFADLGATPLCESFLTADEIHGPEVHYPLHARVCKQCLLVQVHHDVPPAEIFREYAYFSSFSDSWLRHAARFCQDVRDRFSIDSGSTVCEIASNDGYLLRNFSPDIPNTYGVEPAINVAQKAIDLGIKTVTEFFGQSLAKSLVEDGRAADLLIANNVVAHVPELNDFVSGMKTLLKPSGVISIEVPHIERLIEQNQFDTIYHEHYCYFSLHALHKIFRHHGLRIFDVEELHSHGGSIRVFATHLESSNPAELGSVNQLLEREAELGLDSIFGYSRFQRQVELVKTELLEFLIRMKSEGKSVAGYGAPGKGNTLLNFCGIGPELLPYTVDRNPYKHSRFCPGSRIPIYPTETIFENKPDAILILPWNLEKEIASCLRKANEWGAQLFVPIPQLRQVALPHQSPQPEVIQ